jgi:hypothetical protein
MIQLNTKLSLIFLITFLSFIYVVNSIRPTIERVNSLEIKANANDTEKTDYNDMTGDYDSDDTEEEQNDSEVNKLSFIDKVRLLHEEGKNVTFSKYVKHINDTFERLKTTRKNFEYLFETDKIENLKILEFLSEIDTGLSPQCSAAFTRIFSAVGNGDLWSLKCKFCNFFLIVIHFNFCIYYLFERLLTIY